MMKLQQIDCDEDLEISKFEICLFTSNPCQDLMFIHYLNIAANNNCHPKS